MVKCHPAIVMIQQEKDYQPKGSYSKSEESEDKKNDCFLATDSIGTEKLVSGEYNSMYLRVL